MKQTRYTIPSRSDTAAHVPIAGTSTARPHECWSCHHPATHHCGPETPNEGDVCLCLNCTAISIFDADRRLREPTPIELANLSLNPDVRAFQALMQEANRKARRKE